MLLQILREQQGSGGDGRKNVSRQLRLRDRKERYRDDQPEAGEDSELKFEIWLGWGRFPFRPPHSGRLREGGVYKGHPRHERQQNYRKVIPERLGMVVEIAGKAGEIVFENEFTEELRITKLHC